MQLNIRSQDITDYVLGRSNFHPVEKQIDPTVFDIGFNYVRAKNGEVFDQLPEFVFFCEQLETLRRNSKQKPFLEIMRLCSDLEEVAPTGINLEQPNLQ